MAYYGIERSGDTLEHGEWKNKATKYLKKIRVGNKWKYIYKEASNKAKYAVNRVKQDVKGKYYSAKSKLQELEAKVNRRVHGIKDASEVSGRYKNKEYARGWKDDGKARSTTRPYGNRVSTVTGERDLYNNGYSEKSINKNYKGQSVGAVQEYNKRINKERDKKYYNQEKIKNNFKGYISPTPVGSDQRSTNLIGGNKKKRPKSSTHKRKKIIK